MTAAAAGGLRRAAVLGGVTGTRTFIAPAVLALRGRFGKAAKFVVPVLAAGEIVGDKLPLAPPRVQGPGLPARVVSGAACGGASGGGQAARVGAAFALAATYPTQVLRSQIVQRTGIPDIACAIPEDLIGASLATAATPDVDGPKIQDCLEFSAHQHEGRGVVSAAGLGVAAGVVGTAAMTSAQVWLYGLTGQKGSDAPARVGERILGTVGIKVRKQQRPALNTAMHFLYGASWGKAFGLALGRGGRAPGPAQGLAFGASVWAASLGMLPALGLSEAPWKQPVAGLAEDLGFHLVYGLSTAAAFEALAS